MHYDPQKLKNAKTEESDYPRWTRKIFSDYDALSDQGHEAFGSSFPGREEKNNACARRIQEKVFGSRCAFLEKNNVRRR